MLPAVVTFRVFRPWSGFTWLLATAVLPLQSNPLLFWMFKGFTPAHGVAGRGKLILVFYSGALIRGKFIFP